nr:MucR family transcriptional regulator [Novosphingobium arvoryzae]
MKPDATNCLDCGLKGKMLKRDLSTEPNLIPAEHKPRWNLSTNHPS